MEDMEQWNNAKRVTHTNFAVRTSKPNTKFIARGPVAAGCDCGAAAVGNEATRFQRRPTLAQRRSGRSLCVCV